MTEDEALSSAQEILRSTGYVWPELTCEPLEFGWQISAGEEAGAVRLRFDEQGTHRLVFETLRMWWPRPETPWLEACRTFLFGYSLQRPGGHLLWSPVLKARTLRELPDILGHTREMREMVLAAAARRRLPSSRCQVHHFLGTRLFADGETELGVQWWAEVRNGRLHKLRDSAPLPARLQRWLRPRRQDRTS